MGWRLAKTLRGEILPEEMRKDADLWDEKEEAEIAAKIYILPELAPLLEKSKARWRYINHGYQFKFAGGYILCWWPRTGSLRWQGHEKGEDYFLPKDPDVVENVLEFVAIPTLGEKYPEEFPERPKNTRRKPGKGELLRMVEERKATDEISGRAGGQSNGQSSDDRGRDRRSDGRLVENSGVEVLSKDQVRVPAGDERSGSSSGG